MSKWRIVRSGAPQGSVLEPGSFNLFVSDMDTGTECTLSKFADTKLEGKGCLPEDRFERWVPVNFMMSNKAKCKDLHLGWNNPKHKYRLRGEWIESSAEEKDLKQLVDEKLDVTCQCALAATKAHGVLGCIQSRVSSRTKVGNLPLCSSETPPGVLHPALGLSTKEKDGPFRASPKEGYFGQAERAGVVQL
ncbi:hypothetical protein DUI87_16748 [Hirundo rustica rustica]|uniref:Reverse transcriptase domain-containing protein n=1 Tax=Hirundo rustica rustica TaxID=333673 RepID=A0A3M0K8B4_HIRRU|nr:hypothetical protein DUI87_16748 [Hirundo rustica rustica]